MRGKLVVNLLWVLMLLVFSSVCYGQKLETGSEADYKKSMAEVFNKLSPDRQLEFEAFFYCLLDGGKTLVSVSRLKGVEELQDFYPLIEAFEQEGIIKLDGQSADEVIAQGKSLLAAKLNDKIKSAETEAQKENLKAKLAIIKKKTLTKEDLEAYTSL